MRIEVDLDRVKVFLTDIRFKALTNATRSAMNRSANVLRTRTNLEIRKHLKLKAGVINKKHLLVKKARGSRLESMESSLSISGKRLSLIDFVVGNKSPRPQKGIAVKRRKLLRVEVKPGRRSTLKKAFIAKGRGGKNQVFRRRTSKNNPIVKQSITAISTIIERRNLRTQLEVFGRKTFEKEFDRAFSFQLNKITPKGVG